MTIQEFQEHIRTRYGQRDAERGVWPTFGWFMEEVGELNAALTESEAEDKREQEIDSLVENFIQHLEIEDDLARLLVEEGFTTLEEIAYVPLEEMLEIEELDEELVEELRARAKDELLTLAIASEEELDGAQPADDLLEMDGMERHLAFILASRGIVTMEDLAEQSVDDLMDIEGMDEERAAALIMTARAPWFENEQ